MQQLSYLLLAHLVDCPTLLPRFEREREKKGQKLFLTPNDFLTPDGEGGVVKAQTLDGADKERTW